MLGELIPLLMLVDPNLPVTIYTLDQLNDALSL